MKSSIFIDGQIGIRIVDDSAIYRRLLSLLIEKDDRFLLLGVFNSGYDLISNMKDTCFSPSVCLLDILMPKYNGVETSRLLQINYPNIISYGLSTLHDGLMVQQMYQNGVKQVFQKGNYQLAYFLDVIYDDCSKIMD
ncbi:response regulator [Sphingobacterium sp. JUb56]|uniref:response regulator n=1 Tax=Sphingobacterium sp. JUb56 TaxID=2587145 RepID=UPI001619B8AB|nr:response regulator [Sphingobacterium sp. JUb56]MBB2950617.1 DNA-binding NarL/FixJ family response regulator [Sphingobacterium sp. JUb56]